MLFHGTACRDGLQERSETRRRAARTPHLRPRPRSVTGRGGEFFLTYRIEDPAPGASLAVSTGNATWLHSFVVTDDRVTFTADTNIKAEPGSAPRTGTFTLNYPRASDLTITVRQSAPELPEDPGLTFELELVSTAPASAVVNCTPSDLVATYVAVAILKSEYDAYESEEELIANDIENFRNSPWGSGIADHLRTGKLERHELTLKPETPYYFYAYGLEADGTLTSTHIHKLEITVPPRPEILVQEPGLQPAEGSRVTLSYSVSRPTEGCEIQIAPRGEWVHDFTVTADAISFTVDSNADAKPGGEPRETFFTISYPQAYDKAVIVRQSAPEETAPLGFELTIHQVTPSEAVVSCIPTDEQASYVMGVMLRSEYEQYADERALITAQIEGFQRPGWSGEPGTIAENLTTGSLIESTEYLYYAECDYYLYAYGLEADGTITTDGIAKERFTTPAKPVIAADNPETYPVGGGTFEVSFRIANPIPGAQAQVQPPYNAEWLHSLEITEDKVRFTLEPNTAAEPGDAPRTSYFTISYPEAYNKAVTIRQAAPSM